MKVITYYLYIALDSVFTALFSVLYNILLSIRYSISYFYKIKRKIYPDKKPNLYMLVVINTYYRESFIHRFKSIKDSIEYYKQNYKRNTNTKVHVDAYIFNLLNEKRGYIKL